MRLGYDDWSDRGPFPIRPTFRERLVRYGERTAALLNRGYFETVGYLDLDRMRFERDRHRLLLDRTYFTIKLEACFRNTSVGTEHQFPWHVAHMLSQMKDEHQDEWMMHTLNDMVHRLFTTVQTKDPPGKETKHESKHD